MSTTSELGVGLHYLNPAVPFVARLPNTIQAESAILIEGKVLAGTKRFSFAFQNGTDHKTSDIVFYFNPRFDEGRVVVQNDRVKDNWGNEDRTIVSKFPFTYKANFRVVISVTEEYYEVEVNNVPLCKFKHRSTMDVSTHFCILGKIEIHRVSFSEPLSPNFFATIPSRLKVGDMYTIRGHPIRNTANFSVYVQEEALLDSDAHLVVNPRLKQGKVARNHFIDGEWGDDEENSGVMPFSDGKNFELTIVVLIDQFHILFNENKFASFKHRMKNIDTANILFIKGGVSLANVIIESPRV